MLMYHGKRLSGADDIVLQRHACKQDMQLKTGTIIATQLLGTIVKGYAHVYSFFTHCKDKYAPPMLIYDIYCTKTNVHSESKGATFSCGSIKLSYTLLVYFSQ